MPRRSHRPQKMQTQMFKHALLLSMLVLALFSLIIYFYVSGTLIDREHVNLQNLNRSHMTQIEANLRDLDYVTADINYVNRLNGFLTDSEDWSEDSGVINAVLSIVGSSRDAYQLNLYRLVGDAVVRSGLDAAAATQNPDATWLQTAMELRGWKLLSAPYNASHSTSSQKRWYLSISRAALNSKNQVIGALEAIGRCEQIFSSAISYSHQAKEPALLYIFDADGALIYPYEADAIERAFAAQIWARTSENPSAPDVVRAADGGDRYQYVREHSHYSGWSYVSLQRRSVIFRPVFQLILMLACAAAVLIALSALFSWMLARRMVRPVKHLMEFVHGLRLDTLGKVKKDDEPVPFEELDRLFDEFQTMSDSLKTSVQELEVSRQLEFKSQMTALQMQMNPHFYYNTLSCISVLAENGQREEVGAMCRTLSDLMRYITDTRASEVTLSQELDIVRKYLYCMKMRYQDSLNIELTAPEALNAIPVPKLILQPLAENAVKYGTNCIPPWHIRITGRMEADRWYFTVEDSGSGFTPEAIASLSEQIERIDRTDSADLAPQHIGGMGLINVYLRWKLFCHGSEIVEFGNTADGHARVTIGRRVE